jgi:hypothetical protein
MSKRLKFAAKLAVLSFAAAVSLLPTAAAALPTHERLINYLDANGAVIGDLLTTCDGQRYYTGQRSAITEVVYETPCNPEPPPPGGCLNWPWCPT